MTHHHHLSRCLHLCAVPLCTRRGSLLLSDWAAAKLEACGAGADVADVPLLDGSFTQSEFV